jgi:exopolysaccharide biosynthesis polyprenyl glycosylphosphotransferase
MLKENWRLIARLERLGDFIIIVVSFFLAYHGRDSLVFWNDILGLSVPFTPDGLAPLKDYFTVLFIALLGYAATLSFFGAYGSMRLSSPLRLLRISLVSSAIVFILLAATLFLLKLDLSRSFIAIFCTLVGVLLTAERLAVLRLLRFWRGQGKNFRNIIIGGVGEQAVRLAGEIAARPELGIRIRGFADLRASVDADLRHRDLRAGLGERGIQRSGRIIQGGAELERALKEYAVDEVIFTDVAAVMAEVEEMVLVCSEQGVRTTIAADLFSLGMVKSGLSYFGGMPLIHFQTPPGDRWELVVKRALDVVVSATLLVALLPLFGAIALAVRLSTPGPVLFRQRRVGLNGRIFVMFKFRSMYRDAEQRLAELRERNEMDGPVFKLKEDPRITPIGAFLRRFSLDELPQLWNVFIGDMSLVGPRPPIPGEVSLYERRDRRRLSMRPGITCTWQVSGRNEIKDFDAWVKLDLDYIDNWSLGRDVVLLVRTIPAVIFGAGAR